MEYVYKGCGDGNSKGSVIFDFALITRIPFNESVWITMQHAKQISKSPTIIANDTFNRLFHRATPQVQQSPYLFPPSPCMPFPSIIHPTNHNTKRLNSIGYCKVISRMVSHCLHKSDNETTSDNNKNNPWHFSSQWITSSPLLMPTQSQNRSRHWISHKLSTTTIIGWNLVSGYISCIYTPIYQLCEYRHHESFSSYFKWFINNKRNNMSYKELVGADGIEGWQIRGSNNTHNIPSSPVSLIEL